MIDYVRAYHLQDKFYLGLSLTQTPGKEYQIAKTDRNPDCSKTLADRFWMGYALTSHLKASRKGQFMIMFNTKFVNCLHITTSNAFFAIFSHSSGIIPET